MRLSGAAAALLLVLVAQSGRAEEANKPEAKAEVAAEQGKELIMLELEKVGDARDKRQTEGEADFSNKEVPPEYLSLLQQLQLQNAEAQPGQAPAQPDVQQYYIAKTPSGVLSGGPLDRAPQRFLPAPGEPRPFRPRDPVLNAISRQNSALQAEYQRKALRDQETVFLMPRGPVGTDPPRAGPLALAGLYRPGAQAPQPSQGVPVPPGGVPVGLAQQGGLPAFSAHDARLRAALQAAPQQAVQSPQPQYISPQYVQQLQARGLAALSQGPAAELGLVREAAQQIQSRQPQQLQLQPQQLQPQQLQQAPRAQPQQLINYQELTPAELRFVQRQQEQETAPPPQPRYVLQPNPQQLQAQIEAQQAANAEEQYLRETTPGGPPPLPIQPVRAAPQPQPEPQAAQLPVNVLQPSQLYLQQVRQLQEQQALARQQIAAQQQLAAQQQQPSEGVQYIRQPAARPAPQPVAHTTPRSSIYVSTATSPKPKAQPAPLRRPAITIEQLLAAGEEDKPAPGLPVVRLPASPKTLTQADLQQLIDAGFDVSPVADPRDPAASAYYRSSAAGDYQLQAQQQAQQRFAPIVVPDEEAQAQAVPRLSARQRQAYLEAQEEAYLQAAQQQAQQSRGVPLGSSGH